MIDKNKIIGWWNTYKEEFNYDEHKKNSDCYAGMYDIVETQFLYSVIRNVKPSKIIEIGPNMGWTSYVMLEAMKANENKSELISFDLIDNSLCLDRNGDKISRRLIVGDVKETITDYMINNADFVFIDAEHTEDFSRWYCNRILNNIKKDTIIFIHDWEGKEGDKDGEFFGVIKYAVEPGIIKRIFNIMDYVLENNISRTPNNVGYAKGDRSPTEVCIRI